MKVNAIVVHETGGPDVLRWEPVDVAEPGPGQVRLRHTAIGFNMIDTYRRKGLYPSDLPFIPGSEATGVVELVGDGVETVSAGDRVVYAIADTGAYTEQRIIDAASLVKLQEDISDEVAAAAFLKGLTVWALLHRTWPLKAGETILVYAAAGGVGTILCQWASHLGARVIGVVGAAKKVPIARANGCDAVIDYSQPDTDIAASVRSLTGGEGVDVVYDSMGRDTFAASLDSLRPCGLMVSYGNATGPAPPVEVLELMRKGSLFLTRPTLFHYMRTREQLQQGADALFDAIRCGNVRVHVNQHVALADAARAHRAVESRQTTGATVLTV